MILMGIFLHISFICAAITDYCYASQNPELRILQGEQVRGSFCPGSTARLKCVFPEGMEALVWHVNGSDRPIEWRFLSEDYQGHSVDNSIERGYTVVNISKEEPYQASYICAVLRIPDNIRSNLVEVFFKDTPPDDITATCISNGSDSLTVAVYYTSGCRRETVVEANRAACRSVSQSSGRAVFQCVGLRPSTSYNITAVDSDGHVDSLTCSTAKKENIYPTSTNVPNAKVKEPENPVYLVALIVCLPVLAGSAAVLVIVICCCRRKRKHKPQDGAHRESDEQLVKSATCQDSTVLRYDGNPPEDRSQPNDEKPEALLQLSNSDSTISSNGTRPQLPQQQGCNAGLNYAIVDFSSTAGTIKPPSPHDNVSYTTIKPHTH